MNSGNFFDLQMNSIGVNMTYLSHNEFELPIKITKLHLMNELINMFNMFVRILKFFFLYLYFCTFIRSCLLTLLISFIVNFPYFLSLNNKFH